MRRVMGVIGIVVLLNLAIASVAEPVQQPTYASEKPRYVKVVLNEDGSNVLAVAFDESKGTGKGYDLLYADANFNGRFEPLEKRTATVRKCSSGIHCEFPAVKLNVPYSKKALGAQYPCEVTFNYQKHTYQTRSTRPRLLTRILTLSNPAPAAVTTSENFDVLTGVELRQGSARWQYSFRGSIKPSERLNDAPRWSFRGAPTLTIATRPDGQKKGNLGIGLTLQAAGNRFECKSGGLPAKAHVEIKRPDGRVVHRDDAPLDKFTFG